MPSPASRIGFVPLDLAFLAAALIFATGCHKAAPPPVSLTGEWVTKHSAIPARSGGPLDHIYYNPLILRADGTFRLGRAPVEGNYAVGGDTITLSPKTIMGLGPAGLRKLVDKYGLGPLPKTMFRPTQGTISETRTQISFDTWRDDRGYGGSPFNLAYGDDDYAPQPDRAASGRWCGPLRSGSKIGSKGQLINSLSRAFELDLRNDGTSTVWVVAGTVARWQVEKDGTILVIQPASPRTSKTGEETLLKLNLSPDGREMWSEPWISSKKPWHRDP